MGPRLPARRVIGFYERLPHATELLYVLAGTGGNATEEAIYLTKAAEKAGA